MMRFINDFKDIDVSILKIMKNGFKFAFVLELFATYILYFYLLNPISHIAFEVGYSIAKSSLTLFVSFLIGAFSMDKIKKALL